MTEDAERKSTRNAILLAVVVILVAIYCVSYGLQTLVWIEGKQWTSANPWLDDMPKPLATTGKSPAEAKGVLAKAYDYEFVSPWGAAKITPFVIHVQFRFDGGQVVALIDPETSIDTMRNLKSTNPLEYQKFTNVFADHPIEFNSQLYEMVYGAAPSQLSPLGASRDALRMNVLLLWKLSFGFDAMPGIYSFEFGKNHGFQFGDPASGKPVAVRIFEDRDRQFRMIFTVAAGTSGQVKQEDINTVISTFKPIPIIDR